MEAWQASRNKEIGIRLYLTEQDATAHFYLLKEQQAEIEKAFGEPLEWAEMPGKKVVGYPCERAIRTQRTSAIGQSSMNGLLTNWNALTPSSDRVFRHLMLRTTTRLQMRTTRSEVPPSI